MQQRRNRSAAGAPDTGQGGGVHLSLWKLRMFEGLCMDLKYEAVEMITDLW